MSCSRMMARLGLVAAMSGAMLASGPVMAAPGVTLSEAYTSALQNNYGLKSQQYSYRAEQEATREAWAHVLPQLDASASYGQSRFTRDFSVSESISDSDEHTRYDVSLSQVIYSQATFDGIRQAQAGEAVAKTQLDAREQEIGYSVIEAFLNAKRLADEMVIVEQDLEGHRQRLEQINSMRERGFASKADSLQAQARIDEVQADMASLRHELRAARQNLEAISGIDLSDRDLGSVNKAAWQTTPAFLDAPWQELARSNSVILDRAKAEVNYAEIKKDKARAGHFPELFLNARHTNNDTFATNLREETRVEVQLKLPLYSGGGVAANRRKADDQVRSAKFALRDQQNNLSVEVSRLTESLQGSYSRIMALQTAEESAAAALEAAEQGFIGGVRSLTDVLDIRTRLSSIRRELSNEKYTNQTLQYELRQVAGTLSASDVAFGN